MTVTLYSVFRIGGSIRPKGHPGRLGTKPPAPSSNLPPFGFSTVSPTSADLLALDTSLCITLVPLPVR